MRFTHDGTFSSFWSGEKTFVDPDLVLYKQMLHDVPGFLKEITEAAKGKALPAEFGGEGRTATGVVSPAQGRRAPELMTPTGDLTDERVEFLRKKHPERFAAKTPERIRHEFAGEDSGTLLEEIHTEEDLRSRRALGASSSVQIFAKPGQTLSSIAKGMGRRVPLNTARLNMPALDFIKTSCRRLSNS